MNRKIFILCSPHQALSKSYGRLRLTVIDAEEASRVVKSLVPKPVIGQANLHCRRNANSHSRQHANQLPANNGSRGQQEPLPSFVRLAQNRMPVIENAK
jgi:hypothetical protein